MSFDCGAWGGLYERGIIHNPVGKVKSVVLDEAR
ncbi:hypothetical protein [Novosphingobium sp.]